MKTNFVRERFDLRLIARQKMPSLSGAGTTELLQIIPPFRRGEFRGLLRIDAHIHDIEFVADAPPHIVHSLDQAVKRERAEHWTLVISLHQHHRFPTEIIAERDGLSRLVTKMKVERNLCAQLLVETNV